MASFDTRLQETGPARVTLHAEGGSLRLAVWRGSGDRYRLRWRGETWELGGCGYQEVVKQLLWALSDDFPLQASFTPVDGFPIPVEYVHELLPLGGGAAWAGLLEDRLALWWHRSREERPPYAFRKRLVHGPLFLSDSDRARWRAQLEAFLPFRLDLRVDDDGWVMIELEDRASFQEVAGSRNVDVLGDFTRAVAALRQGAERAEMVWAWPAMDEHLILERHGTEVRVCQADWRREGDGTVPPEDVFERTWPLVDLARQLRGLLERLLGEWGEDRYQSATGREFPREAYAALA